MAELAKAEVELENLLGIKRVRGIIRPSGPSAG